MNRKRSLKPLSRRARNRRGPAYERTVARHARGRLAERYGIHITLAELAHLERHIRNPQPGMPAVRRLYDPDPDTRWYAMQIEGKAVVACWDRFRGCIRTFVPVSDLAFAGIKLEGAA